MTSSDLGEMSQFDFIKEDSTFFWVDLLEEKIRMVRLPYPFACDEDISWDGSLNVTDLFSVSLMPYDGFACDWVSRNLYWVDSEEGRIEVGSIEGRWRKTLVWSGLDQPRDLMVDPVRRYMYWLDVGEEPRIERCGLDGSDRSTLVKRPMIGLPFTLTLDLIGQNIYWLDQDMNGIYFTDLDGNDIRKLPNSNISSIFTPSFFYSFSMVVGRECMYLMDNRKLFLKMADKFNLTSSHNVWRFSEPPREMKLWENQEVTEEEAQRTKLNACKSSGCSHLCLSSPQHPFFSCACPSGVVLLSDNETCNDGPSQMLLLARQTDVRKISLDTPDLTDAVLTNEDHGTIVAIDYDPVDQMVYWTDVDLHVIKRSKITGEDVEVVLDEGIHTPEGLAIDWISRSFYWTDTGTDRIEVSDMRGAMRKVIVGEMLDEPRALAVDPYQGILFWSDWGSIKRIERSLLDGSNRTTVVDWSISWPNGLALDRPMKRLYWADAQFDSIESCNYEGADRRKVISGDLPHVFGLALIGDYIYWTEWHRRVLERANKVTGQSRLVILEDLPNLMGLAAYSKDSRVESRLDTSSGCSPGNGGCSHFCFRMPGEARRCSCPDGLVLSDVDERSCRSSPAFIVFNNDSHVMYQPLVHFRDEIDLELEKETDLDNDDDSNNGKDGDDDDDDEEGSHDASNNFYKDDDYEDEDDDKVNVDGIRGEESSSRSNNVESTKQQQPDERRQPKKLLLDYSLSAGVVLSYDTQSKMLAEYRLDSLMDGDDDDDSEGRTTMQLQTSTGRSASTFALDWLSDNVYWTDWDKIEMSRRNGSSRRIIVWQNCRPRTITVDPLARFLFWSNEMNSFGTIERTSLDGSSRVIIIRNLGQVTGMALDPDSLHLYWADQKLGQIEHSSYDGSERATLVSNVEPYRIAWFENVLYWSNADGQIVANDLTRENQKVLKVIAKDLRGGVDVKVIHPSIQQGSNFCSMTKNNGGCSDLCISLKEVGSKVTHKCSCPTQFVLSRENNSTCEAPSVAAYLATSNRIMSLSLEEISESPDIVLPFQSSNSLRSIEYDPFRDVIYFIEGSSKISSMKSDASQVATLLDTSTEGSPVARMVPFDMVLDPANDILYWSDMTYGTIVMTRIEGSMEHVVFNLGAGDGLRKPKYLALHSDRQILFWTNGMSIEAAFLKPMTTHDVTLSIIINGSKVGPLCVDGPTNTLYWFNIDAHSIEMSKLNGEGRRVIVEGVRSSTGFGVSGSHLYWVDKEKQTFESCLKGSGKQRSITRGRLPTGLKDLIILNRKKLLKDKLRKKVDPPSGTTLDLRTDCPVDHFSCFMVRYDYSSQDQKNSFDGAHKSVDWKADGMDLNINDVGCIPTSWKCDGNVDCSGAYDELNCTSCKEDSMLCLKDRKCVGKNLICDGKVDCSDGSDEAGCLSCLEPKSSTFNGRGLICHPGLCHSSQHVCDGFVDCENGADELDCFQADGLQWRRGFDYWLTIASVVICASLAAIAVLIFALGRKSNCYGCLQRRNKEALDTTEPTFVDPGTSSSVPRYISPHFSTDKHLLSASSCALDVSPENLGGPYPSLATSFADSGLTSTDKSCLNSGGSKRNKDLQKQDVSSFGSQRKTYGNEGWQFCENDLYFPFGNRENVDEIPALPPPPPTPCSQSRLIRSRQTSSTGSSNCSERVTPASSLLVRSPRRKGNFLRSPVRPPLDCLLDPCLALPPSGRSSNVSRNRGNSENSSGLGLQRFSTPVSGDSKLR